MNEAGALKTVVLAVGGAFHSPLMEPAKKELEAAIRATSFKEPLSDLPKCSTNRLQMQPRFKQPNQSTYW